jgi:hypothetical protein
MAYFSLKDVSHVMFDGVNVADGIDNITIKVAAKTAEHHACGQVFPYNFPLGLYEGEMTIGGWMDSVVTTPTTGGKINALSTAGGSDMVVSVLIEGNTVSNRCWSYQAARVSEVEAVLSLDDVHKLTPGITVRGAVDYGFLATPYATRATAGNTDTAYADMGAISTPGARAYLHVGALTLGGATSATVVVRHSSDHITFNPHGSGSFANVTATPTNWGQCITLTGLVNRYISTSWIYNGGAGTNISYLTTIFPFAIV